MGRWTGASWGPADEPESETLPTRWIYCRRNKGTFGESQGPCPCGRSQLRIHAVITAAVMVVILLHPGLSIPDAAL